QKPEVRKLSRLRDEREVELRSGAVLRDAVGAPVLVQAERVVAGVLDTRRARDLGDRLQVAGLDFEALDDEVARGHRRYARVGSGSSWPATSRLWTIRWASEARDRGKTWAMSGGRTPPSLTACSDHSISGKSHSGSPMSLSRFRYNVRRSSATLPPAWAPAVISRPCGRRLATALGHSSGSPTFSATT